MTTISIFECEGTTLTKYRGRRKHLDTFPPGIEGFGNEAFYGRKSLESIVLPQGLIIIHPFALMDCIHLKSKVIPDSVSPTYGCMHLQGVRVWKPSSFLVIWSSLVWGYAQT